MILYFLLWFILIGKFDIEGFVVGLCMILIVFMLNGNTIKIKKFNSIGLFLYRFIMYLKYLGILIKEIIIAGIQVARIVMSITPNCSPCIVEYRTKIKGRKKLLLFCNSITLTPGTLTIGIEGDVIKIHCLTDKNAKDLENNIFENIILGIEKKEEEYLNG